MSDRDSTVDPPAGLTPAGEVLARVHALSDQKPGSLASLAALSALPAWFSATHTVLFGHPDCAKATEWLMDNDYVIERALRQIRKDLPRGYYARLPALITDDESLPPRAYVLAHRIVQATSLQLAVESLVQFVSAYQRTHWLELAELWALPTMLRLTCIETLVLALVRLAPELRAPFEVARGEELELRLSGTECVARSIRGLAMLDAISWPSFVDEVSAIDSVLQHDPAAAYRVMDAATRDHYRGAVEDLARRSHHDERDVSRRALALARAADGGSRAAHVGYWLVAEGRERLERSLRYTASWPDRLRRRLRRRATEIYLGSLLLLTAFFVAIPVGYLSLVGATTTRSLLALPLLLLPASMLAVTVLHWFLSRILPPTVLPKLSFSEGVPPECKTAVAIPSLLGSSDDVEHLVRQIERHHLANPDPSLRFVLLTGFTESDEPHQPEDDALLDQAKRGVALLNRRHAGNDRGPFHLLHRARRFNAAEGRWMGWERKRGKLEEFNRLLLGDRDTGFQVHVGEERDLENVRFVITLDADTALPQAAAARLIGTLAHPLNRPTFDRSSGRVVAGYTVVQPRIETSPSGGRQTPFTRLHCGDTAIDIYSRAVSDIYQDLFGTGIYVGKAIYDVAAFSQSLAGRVPENALASHDLFEGIHGRAALATDIVLYEDYPPSYLAFTRRLHRWVRGDWQLLPWLRRFVPGARYDYLPNRFAWIDRWKVIDNLRRSLLPTGLLLLLVSGWTWLPGHPLAWTLFAILAPTGHLFIDFATGVVRERWRLSPHFSRALSEDVGRWLLMLVFLPHQAALTADAIVRTLIRITLTKRHLLEWTTSAHAAASVARQHPVALSWTEMSAAPLLAAIIAVGLFFGRPDSLVVAAPLLLLWTLSPEIARRISRVRDDRLEALDPDDVDFFRRVARRTWLFFESFVGPDGHWLPPDNYQEDPGRVVAHRTSPTNIGMLMLSTIAAYDLGYIGLEQLVLRLRHTLRTVAMLEHYRGHLLNWYHTRTLEPLSPHYVSTVDSGNLAAALLTVEANSEKVKQQPCLRRERWQGLVDTIELLREGLSRLFANDVAQAGREFVKRGEAMHALAIRARDAHDEWTAPFDAIETSCGDLEASLVDAVVKQRLALDLTAFREARLWLTRVHDHVRGMRHEVESFAPWLGVFDAMPVLREGSPEALELKRLRTELIRLLAPSLSLAAFSATCAQASAEIDVVRSKLSSLLEEEGDEAKKSDRWLSDLEKSIAAGVGSAERLGKDLSELGSRAEGEALGMDFGWLYDRRVRHLFIGYNVSADQMDSHHYDLLASEARLTSLIAIAKGDVPAEHWFALDRPLTRSEGATALLSWGGTMFEYLMPPLLARSQSGTLLAESQRTAVLEQMADARRLGVPWGVSESGFAAFDADHNYQYRAFGVQGLGRARGLADDRVIAPYASALAAPLFPRSAARNLRSLRDLGMLGSYGFHEAIDFTPSRLPEGRDHAIVASYMSHHQGMILAAIDNLLCDDALVERFEANPRVRPALLLLQERMPAEFPIEEPRRTVSRVEPAKPPVALHPWRPAPGAARPHVHLLGNGRLSSRLTDAGGGALRWREHSITRSVPDGTLDDSGLWIYVRDQETGDIWSVGRQPTGGEEGDTDVVFHAHMAELHRRQHGIAIRTDIAIAPADDIEVRRVTVVNETDRARLLTFTSYGEVVLAPARDDARHMAFSKLFVEGSRVPRMNALVFNRHPRSPQDHYPVVMHRLIADSEFVSFSGFETDRERFLGRNGSLRSPRGLEEGLSGTEGATLDSIMAVSAEVELEAHATCQLAFVTIVGPTRQSVDDTARRYETLASFEWLLTDAQVEAAHEAARLDLLPERLPELQALASALLAPQAQRRATPAQVAANQLGQQGLWGLGISGDHPLLVVETEDLGPRNLLADLLRGHRLFTKRGMAIDLILLSRAATGYRDAVWENVQRLLEDIGAGEWIGRRGGIHLVRADQVSEEQRLLLLASASVIVDAEGEPLKKQLAKRTVETLPLPSLTPTRARGDVSPDPVLQRPGDLLFDNGLGGFSPDGREYVMHLEAGETTPAPWCNVLANEDFGCLVSEAGGGYTWSGNSGEFRLTPWTNDPVLDAAGESLYLRDEETAEVWTPTPGPAGSSFVCQVRHGAGYTEWTQHANGLACRVRVFVPVDDPVKIVELHLRNHESRPRRITATYYARWLLASGLAEGVSHVVAHFDGPTRSLRARNSWNADFADRVAFLTSDREVHGWTTDREEFLGREGDPRSPEALSRIGLAGTQFGVDPCGALQIHLDLGPGEEVCSHFVLGASDGVEHANRLVEHWRDPEVVIEASQRLSEHWDSLLSAVTVRTPDPAMDVLLNRWAIYQALSSRILARTGFYQSSGAYGFRDQLQDVLALLHCDPARTRAHILECARHQFEEGDVLHWWHPPLGRGVRTRCSDDLLWLPYATACYVEATGDLTVLDESVPFLSAPMLGADEHERYALYEPGSSRASLFEHCRRALERGLTRGSHGLPLIGDCDWNDGMNRVGSKGRGESVWLGWFAGVVARDFARLCERRGDGDAAESFRARAEECFAAARESGWDGSWYRRAFDDEGVAWGSSSSEECRIDSIAQSWSVISGAAPSERASLALRSAETALVREDEQLVRLLWPPFHGTKRDPGYIKAYPPGIRENGGHYSHAAAWLGWAFAVVGDGERAVHLFDILNPVNHASTAEAARRYRIEPYVIAADIASTEPHVGRGGWSWYTGAAAWCWRLGVEAILGLQRVEGGLRIAPRIPAGWPGFEATIRTAGGVLEISVDNIPSSDREGVEIVVDGAAIEGDVVTLPENGAKRRVAVRVYASQSASAGRSQDPAVSAKLHGA